MEKSEFTDNAAGRLVPIAGGRPDVAFAFIPNPLPPQWKWQGDDMWRLLLEARSALSSLDGTGKHLPNDKILLRPIQSREAQLSSQLEGTFTDPHKQALFQADPRYPTSANDPTNAYREVFNYGLALHHSVESKLPLSKRLIRDLHKILMDGVRGYGAQPGEFRTIQNQIGHPARFVPPPPEEVDGALDALETYIHSKDAFDPLVRAFLIHYQFETIHPFRDGNGRVGRLLLALNVASACGLSSQWLYMSPYFEAHRKEYMDLLLRVSTHGDWESWIRFCLVGVLDQSADTERRCERLLELHRDFHQRLKGGSVRLSSLVDELFENPIVSVISAMQKYEVTHPTARADLKRLEGLGILERLNDVSTITYYCPMIFNVIYDGIEALPRA